VNRYKVKFNAVCPVNGDSIEYSMMIESSKMIEAERIMEVVSGFKSGFHEVFADALHKKFGGKHFMTAIHSGVLIETERG